MDYFRVKTKLRMSEAAEHLRDNIRLQYWIQIVSGGRQQRSQLANLTTTRQMPDRVQAAFYLDATGPAQVATAYHKERSAREAAEARVRQLLEAFDRQEASS